MNALKKSNDKLYWILLGLLGLILIIFHNGFDTFIPVVAGVGLIIAGAVGLLGWWGMRNDKSAKVTGQLIGALLMVVIGIWALINKEAFARLINIAGGIILILVCVQRLRLNRGFKLDKTIGVVCVVGIVLGALMLRGGVDITTTGPLIIGCGLLYTACVGLLKKA